MNSFSYLSYKDCKAHDQYLLKNGHTMSSLIHTAGKLISAWIIDQVPNRPLVGIIGKGNNGNDILSTFNHFPIDIDYQYLIIDPKIKKSPHYQKLPSHKEITSLSELPKDAVIIDGIFGTGLNKPLETAIEALIKTINQLSNTVIAIDIPSGLSEKNDNLCIKANTTLSMMFPKKVFLNPTKKEKCGEIYVLNFKLTQDERNGHKFPNLTDNYIKIL